MSIQERFTYDNLKTRQRENRDQFPQTFPGLPGAFNRFGFRATAEPTGLKLPTR